MTGETVALTYAELADHLGIEVASAKMRARRGRWRREPGNDGKTRVQVPVEVLEAPSLGAPAPPAPPSSDTTALVALREAHAAEIARMEVMHRAAVDVLREAHLAEVTRIELAQQRDREAHAFEVERIRADHAAELARLVEAHQRAMTAQHPAMGRARARLAMAARWMAEITNRTRR